MYWSTNVKTVRFIHLTIFHKYCAGIDEIIRWYQKVSFCSLELAFSLFDCKLSSKSRSLISQANSVHSINSGKLYLVEPCVYG